MQILNLWDTLEEWSNNFRAWLFEHYNNPLLWIGIVVIGVVVFKSVYATLNRDK